MKRPECNGEMEEGIIVDKMGNIGVPTKPYWGTKIKDSIGHMFDSVENFKYVITYRCKSCGFLKSYAK